jgi:beta-glucuronidase
MCDINGGLRWAAGVLLACWFSAAPCGESQVIQNVLSRPGMTLTGNGQGIVDPYENGYYDYRREPFDAVNRAAATS